MPENTQKTPPTTEESAPTPQYNQAPVPPSTPYAQQPVNQQYFAQPQAAPVQYVVTAESLKGLKGWLLFFAIIFAFAGLSYISVFFASLANPSSSTAVVNIVFGLLLAGAYITTTVLISLQKRIARWVAIGTLGLSLLYNITISIVGFAASSSSSSSTALAGLLSGIIASAVVTGLFSLYFIASRRVKETLVN